MQVNGPFQSIEWTDEMALGIPVIDKQHRFLVELLQDANEKLASDQSNFLLSKIVKDLLGYAITHFETEEKLMQRYGYAAANPEEMKEHIEQHRDFSHQVVTICDRLREGREVSHEELLVFLNNWLHNHLLGTDQQYGEFLRKAMDRSNEITE
jgi:hemerythrin-like metal-binding protein